ncbi:beta-ketoacyl synthase N-terminal-like domain-containing protein [Flavobacterium sp. Fl-77]|uniref:Beta-ketoacyl synthase N-terminal-like domain-containing protein n=1 Tax=Flavobacterium flavipigmentatum TaxID=2893884 RepID=A0AAJ2SED0_9FLAO|nr:MULTISPECIES: beta-ketoacyl synthase N-terminal-like domain-containing protein [unclassified Flavobacterium]MDX6183155.1 beta-ketoacyl synthase N-terminal-like domain-containing protein [Flavobacterium sp. Fl-33]MDX6186776.1 beta-ketoacyl synthase N-terminal-like domain-containing protein [Flavobacterium sp. Fl-77]UFH40430.1 phosphopantetheine-binding protein [Flavobacterium sp. F-70]
MAANNNTGLEIAIIGISCRVPGANDWRMFWDNLLNGEESITKLSEQELLKRGFLFKESNNNTHVPVVAELEDKGNFDAAFFGFTSYEASIMSPVHRMFLQSAWEALEDAGYASPDREEEISIYVGSGDDTPWKAHIMLNNNVTKLDSHTLDFITNKDHLPTLTSYKLNLKGPSFSINTACSSSLSAIHLACRGLLFGEAKLALTGGISLVLEHKAGYEFKEGSIYSKDGHCKAFDKGATGTIGSEGLGIVILKRLEDAVKDNDHIYAVIKGSAANNDGNRKVGYTAPSVEGEMECIRMAHKIAGIDADSVSYVEAHGTGTTLGDPIEVEALNRAFENDTNHKCLLGSVKNNIGHTDTAAGVIGLIKTALSLKYRQIPGTINFSTPNPKINFNEGPFYVKKEIHEWKSTNKNPLRAGVSSFGIGGTNVHLVLEEAPEKNKNVKKEASELFLFSARSKDSLQNYLLKFKAFLKNQKDVSLNEVAYTLQTGRKHFDYRAAISCKNKEELIMHLDILIDKENVEKITEDKKTVLLFFPDMNDNDITFYRNLYQEKEDYRNQIDKHIAALELSGYNLKKWINETTVFTKSEDKVLAKVFVLLSAYTFANLLKTYGTCIDFTSGTGIGEYTAACVSGILQIEEVISMILYDEKEMKIKAAQIPFIQAAKDVIIKEGILTPIKYWVNRRSLIINASKSFSEIVQQNPSVILEIGDSNNLVAFLKTASVLNFTKEKYVSISLSSKDKTDKASFILKNILKKLWLEGENINWKKNYDANHPAITSLPVYEFEKNQYPHIINLAAESLNFIKKTNEKINTEVKAPVASKKNENTSAVIKSVFVEFLGLEKVDIDKDLFEIGCDSLKGMLVLNKIKNELQIELSLMDFMEHSSVREVIETIEAIKNKQYKKIKTITI